MNLIPIEQLKKKFAVAGFDVSIKEPQENYFIVTEKMSGDIHIFWDNYDYEYKGERLTTHGWIIAYEAYTPSTRLEPDSIDMVEYSHQSNINSAICDVCSLIISLRLQRFDESTLDTTMDEMYNTLGLDYNMVKS